MWDLPRPGLEPMSPALAGGFLTTAPPGKSLTIFFNLYDLIMANDHFTHYTQKSVTFLQPDENYILSNGITFLAWSVTAFGSNLDSVQVIRAQLNNKNSEVKLLSQSWEAVAWETHINPGVPVYYLTTQMKRQSGHCLFPLWLHWQGSILPFLVRVVRNLI